MMKHYVRLACFVGGALFGSAGVKLLASKDAKKAYTHITAAGLRIKDSVMETVTDIQENAADILAAARDINEARSAREAEARVEGQEAEKLRKGAGERLPFSDYEERSTMRATIVHESRGRMRLRLRQKTMSLRQADLLEAWLKSQPWTKEAVVHERTCCVIVTYAGERDTVLAALSGFTWAGAEEAVTLPGRSTRR